MAKEEDDQQKPVSEIKPCGIHELVVNPGEDMVKIFENFYRQYKHQIIDIVSVNGTVSKVKFEAGLLSEMQYEGEVFELDDHSITLVDDSEVWAMHTRMTTKLDGRVISGILGVRGSLIADSPIHMCLSTCEKKTDAQTDQQPEMDPNNAVDKD